MTGTAAEPMPAPIAPLLAAAGPLPSGPWALEFKLDGLWADVRAVVKGDILFQAKSWAARGLLPSPVETAGTSWVVPRSVYLIANTLAATGCARRTRLYMEGAYDSTCFEYVALKVTGSGIWTVHRPASEPELRDEPAVAGIC